ncbi:uncharacterized protein N7473_011184 [Penicillium subrubescens]|uniref:uncharacterized protein n=1 Tax=Penicillium subrubescens TaxID=1316194 RepID=UPI0025452CF5|nr:uncharacterized protein N7473_011184 [Penicillium subrubescens]KAJ5882750.1 hypothetical protein N7473_011184 [Penicillium subrubescens]
MGVSRRHTANSNIKPDYDAIMVLAESAIEDFSGEVNRGVEEVLAKMSVKVCEAVEAAIKKTSNAGPSAVSTRKEANPIAPRFPVNAGSTLKNTSTNDCAKRQPEERAPAPERILPAARDQCTY